MHILERALLLVLMQLCFFMTNAQDDSALDDYVRIYRKYLHRDSADGGCAMYPSCSQYGLMVFEDCYFPNAMVYMADRMIRCGHDFDYYDLTLQNGQIRMLDYPPYLFVPKHYVYAPKEYYTYTDWREKQDSIMLFINKLVNMHRYREALFEIERLQTA